MLVLADLWRMWTGRSARCVEAVVRCGGAAADPWLSQSQMKLSLNARARIVAETFLSTVRTRVAERIGELTRTSHSLPELPSSPIPL